MRTTFRTLWTLATVATVVCLAHGASALETACSDGADDDVDGATDCADADCGTVAPCFESVAVDWVDASGVGSWYSVSWPEKPHWPDAAVTRPGAQCVGEPGGPIVGDGLFHADDILCAYFSAGARAARAGQMEIQTYDHEVVRGYLIRQASWSSFTSRIALSGNNFLLDPSKSYRIWVRGPAGASGTLEGACDPTWAGDPLVDLSPTLGLRHARMPFRTEHDTADEVLCGTEGVDWRDDDADGRPDTCPGGIFDGATTIGVGKVVEGTSMASRQHVRRTVVLVPGLGLDFLGDDFAIAPGQGIVIQVSSGHETTTWFPERSEVCP